MPLAALVVLAMRATQQAAGPIADPDAWWHLRMGREFWSGTWSLTDTGPMSRFATEEWIPRDWLPQLVASRLETWFGLPGVAWLYGASLLVFLVVSYLVCRRVAAPLPAALAVALGFIGAGASLSQRPQMVSFILMVIFVGAWLATARDLKARWWLVPLMWVWANSHGMWYCGIVVGLTVVAGLMLDHRVDLRRAVKLAGVSVAGLLTAALTPAGPATLLTAFQTTDKWRFVTEWAPPNFMSVAPAVTLGMVALLAVAGLRQRARVSWVSIGLVLLALAWTVLAARTVAVGAVTLMPLVAACLQAGLGGEASRRPSRPEIAGLLVPMAMLLGVLALVVPRTASEAGGSMPVGLSTELDLLPQGTGILNSYLTGGWLHWRHPELDTVIDGFTDGYTLQAMEDYGLLVAVAPGWEEYVEDRDLGVALLEDGSPLAFALTDRLGWQEMGTDEGMVLLVRPPE